MRRNSLPSSSKSLHAPALAAAIIVMLATSPLWAQAEWSAGSGGAIYYNGGNVGIGTAAPQSTLEVGGNILLGGSQVVQGYLYSAQNQTLNFLSGDFGGAAMIFSSGTPASATERMRIVGATGDVGIGTATPAARLGISQVSATARQIVLSNSGDHTGDYQEVRFQYSQTNPLIATAIRSVRRATSDYGAHLTFLTEDGAGGFGERMRIDAIGNVGIGTTTPAHTLSVNGTIGTKEVIVTNTGWADYVFKPDYRLQPLTEVAAYVQQHQRLPGIPSEQEVREKGVSLGEMQAKLLAKIEELTLHLIQMDETNRQLQVQNLNLEERNHALHERVARLEHQFQTAGKE